MHDARHDQPPVPIIDPYWLWPATARDPDRSHAGTSPSAVGAQPSNAPLPGGDVHVDVAIVGGGLAGLSAAYHLLRRWPGARVLVLEAERLAAGASGRTTGMLSPGVGQSLPALARRLGPDRARALYRQTLRAVQDVQQLITQESIDCDLRMTGQLIVARTPSASAARRRLAQQAALMRALDLGDAVQILDDAQLAQRLRLCPLPTRPPSRADSTPASAAALPAALRFPTAGILNPVKLVAGLATLVRARGGHIWERARVRRIDDVCAFPGPPAPQRGRMCARLQLTTGSVTADHVVVAAAGYAPQLDLLRGRLLPVQLQALITEPLSDADLRAIGWSGRDGVLDARRLFSYFRLTEDQRILFGGGAPRYPWGGTAVPPSLSQPLTSQVVNSLDHPAERDPSLARALLHLVADLRATFPTATPPRIVGGWGGVIGYVLDALPVIGRIAERPHIVHAVGWCGHGVALATASGAWVADLICDGAPPADLPWFRASAPAIPTELARAVGFRLVTGYMALQDRFA